MENQMICGKTADTVRLQDELTGALIGLSRAANGNNAAVDSSWKAVIKSLFMTVPNVNFDGESIRAAIHEIHEEKKKLVPRCSACASPCGRTGDFDMKELWNAQEDIRSLKTLILLGLRGMAAYAYHAMVLGYSNVELNRFFYKALYVLGADWTAQELLPVAMEVGEYNLVCMEMLNQANTQTCSVPEPTLPL